MRAEDERAETVAITRGRLKRRADFLRVGKGRRWHGNAMTVQAGPDDGNADGATQPARFGFTLTKKVGNSVVRNRARRRLREAVRLAPPDLPARDGHDYVIVGRVEALRLPFRALGEELARGIAAVHTHGKQAPNKHAHGKRREGDRGGAGDRIAPAEGGPERTRPEP